MSLQHVPLSHSFRTSCLAGLGLFLSIYCGTVRLQKAAASLTQKDFQKHPHKWPTICQPKKKRKVACYAMLWSECKAPWNSWWKSSMCFFFFGALRGHITCLLILWVSFSFHLLPTLFGIVSIFPVVIFTHRFAFERGYANVEHPLKAYGGEFVHLWVFFFWLFGVFGGLFVAFFLPPKKKYIPPATTRIHWLLPNVVRYQYSISLAV